MIIHLLKLKGLKMMNELFLNNECVKIEQIDIECLAFLQSHSPK